MECGLPNNLTSIPRTYMIEGENQFLSYPLTCVCAMTHVHVHTKFKHIKIDLPVGITTLT